MKRKKHSLQKGKKQFDIYFTSQYKERWTALSETLLKKKSYISIHSTNTSPMPLDSTHTLNVHTDIVSLYYLDTASYIVAAIVAEYIYAHTLHSLLDMCTAPGGKLLALYTHFLHITQQKITHDKTQNLLNITANDKSPIRLSKAKHTIQNFLNSTQRDTCIFTCKNATLFGKHTKQRYDIVLLDTPCSNERQVYQSKSELAKWNPKRCTRMALQQRTLLCAAIDACKKKGLIAYITCSLSNEENDMLIAQIKKKRDITCITHNTILHSAIANKYKDYIEKTNFGIQILPDISNGAGPMYMCLLQHNRKKI